MEKKDIAYRNVFCVSFLPEDDPGDLVLKEIVITSREIIVSEVEEESGAEELDFKWNLVDLSKINRTCNGFIALTFNTPGEPLQNDEEEDVDGPIHLTIMEDEPLQTAELLESLANVLKQQTSKSPPENDGVTEQGAEPNSPRKVASIKKLKRMSSTYMKSFMMKKSLKSCEDLSVPITKESNGNSKVEEKTEKKTRKKQKSMDFNTKHQLFSRQSVLFKEPLSKQVSVTIKEPLATQRDSINMSKQPIGTTKELPSTKEPSYPIPVSRQQSGTVKEPPMSNRDNPSSRRNSTTAREPPTNLRESNNRQSLTLKETSISHKESTPASRQSSTQKEPPASHNPPSQRDSIPTRRQSSGSLKEPSLSNSDNPLVRRNSITTRESTSHRESTSNRHSLNMKETPTSHRESTPASRQSSTQKEPPAGHNPPSRRPSVSGKEPLSIRESISNRQSVTIKEPSSNRDSTQRQSGSLREYITDTSNHSRQPSQSISRVHSVKMKENGHKDSSHHNRQSSQSVPVKQISVSFKEPPELVKEAVKPEKKQSKLSLRALSKHTRSVSQGIVQKAVAKNDKKSKKKDFNGESTLDLPPILSPSHSAFEKTPLSERNSSTYQSPYDHHKGGENCDCMICIYENKQKSRRVLHNKENMSDYSVYEDSSKDVSGLISSSEVLISERSLKYTPTSKPIQNSESFEDESYMQRTINEIYLSLETVLSEDN